MLELVLTVKYINLKTCFCYLSKKNVNLLNQNCVKLVRDTQDIGYFSVSTTNEYIDNNSIGINVLYAKLFDLNENQTVLLTEIDRLPIVKSMTVIPSNEDDYELLELMALNVQSTLLNLIRVVNNEQKFIIWIGDGIYLTVDVENIKSIAPGFLDNFTEVIIKQPVPIQKLKENTERNENIKSLQDSLVKTNNTFTPLKNYYLNEKTLVLNVLPSSYMGKIINLPDLFKFPFNVFLSKHTLNLENFPNTKENTIVYTMTPCHLNELIYDNPDIFVRLCVVEDFLTDSQTDKIPENLFISEDLLCILKNCRKVKLKPYSKHIKKFTSILIYTNKKNVQNIKNDLHQYFYEKSKEIDLVLNTKIPFNIKDDVKCFVQFVPSDLKFVVIDYKTVLTINFEVQTDNGIEENLENDELPIDYIPIVNHPKIIDFILSNFLNKNYKMNNILIKGKGSSGKTTVLKLLKNKLKDYPYGFFTKFVMAKELKGKTIDSLHKYFSNIFYDLILNQPSILFIDDINILCGNVNENDLLNQNAIYYNRFSEMLYDMYRNLDGNNILIFATTSDQDLNKSIYSSRGCSLLETIFEINDLDMNNRKILLEHLFSKYKTNNIDYHQITMKTESFSIQDLKDFVERIIYESLKINPNSDILELNGDIYENAFKNTTIQSLHNAHLSFIGNKDFSDVGGMEDIKNKLIENLLWPIKYPNLFEHSPLRLPTSLLLYGPPGTGKTLLVGAAAKQCNLRIIVVKGPELLSKYIGASEAAVRNVFERAYGCKPCILFFDEFDSLAPRRGHDNTGVTDRVVNQILTHLDGIETLTGVCVLAATSRPDLLDPALLRPGRLDNQVYCSLPDQADRLDILKVLTKSIKLSSAIDLEKLSVETDGLSGADLQSILCSAYLQALERLKLYDDDCEIEISGDDLLDVLKKFRPSLSVEERIRYEQRYRLFQGVSVIDYNQKSKVTLA